MRRPDSVSVTTIEAYRLMTAEVISEESLVDQINRAPPSPEAMERIRVGKEVADLLELGLTHFIAANPNPAIDPVEFERMFEPEDRQGLPEFWVGGELLGRWVAAKVDLILGKEIREFKTTGQFDADKYIDSVQWRFYLLLGNLDRCTFRVFERANDRESARVKPKSSHTLTMTRYPGMHGDCVAMLQEFEQWERSAIERGLIKDWRT